jgi:hypothetical protein
LSTTAAPAAIADRVSPHEAKALAWIPTNRIKQAANFVNIRIVVDFIVLSLLKVGGHSANSGAGLGKLHPNLLTRAASYGRELAMPQCKLEHLSNSF